MQRSTNAGAEREFGDPLRGWQQIATKAGDERALEMHLSQLDAGSRALLLSQAGPHAARILTVFPTSPELTVPSAQLRVVLLRRLRLALPVAPRTCACRGRLDPLGDHRAACANSGVLASRALPLERAVVRVCQEAGARVARNVRLADMNVDVPIFFSTDLLENSSARSQCRKLTEDVSGTEMLEIHKIHRQGRAH